MFDPFAGMTPAERKRSQERAILEMVFDLDAFASVTERERPDFVVTSVSGWSFGVEVTQMFPNESVARLYQAPGYMERLWSGGKHLHKADKSVLEAAKVEVRDEHGNPKARGLPVVVVKKPPISQFRDRLRETLVSKAEKGYEQGDLEHLSLIVLDYFNDTFDPDEYSTGRFIDKETRQVLLRSPFRDIYLLVKAPPVADIASEQHPAYRVIPLQLLLIAERVFVTGWAIDEEYRSHVRDVAHLNDLTIDHVSRVQGYGEPVEYREDRFLRYRGSLVGIREDGVEILDHHHFPLPESHPTTITARLPSPVEEEVSVVAAERVASLVFAEHARRPTIYVPENQRSQTLELIEDSGL